MVKPLLIFALWLGFAIPATAQCRLALLLALDISSSVSVHEDRLQRQGLAAALRDAEVSAAILSGPWDVALAVYEWSGRYQQDDLLDWTFLSSRDELEQVATRIETSRRRYAEFPTAAGFALDYALEKFKTAPDCDARTLDVSGDGINNDGHSPYELHREHRFRGMVVNGLIIGGATNRREDDIALMNFYRNEVIYGPGAFVEAAEDYNDFAAAMRRKLIREVEAPVFGALE